MTDYTDPFGGSTVPPSQDRLNIVALTADATMYWPYEYTEEGIFASDIIEISTDTDRTVIAPAASSASLGAGFVLRNTGAFTITVLDGAGGGLTTVLPGVAKHFYVKANNTVAGTWSVLTFGTGTSDADANSLVGSGLVVLSNSLASGVDITESSGSLAVTSVHRAQLLVNTGGSVTFTLDLAADLGENFYTTFRNSGLGTLTIATTSSQTIDGETTLTIAPGETATVVRNSNEFYSFGQGRTTTFAFTQLNITLSSGTRTITTDEAANKMLNFTGSPATDVEVTLPSFSSIYYVYNNLTTADDITFTTGSGDTTLVPQGQRGILFVDSVNVVSAQSPAATGAVQFVDGSSASPSITFASDTDTGLYRSGADVLGVSVNGISVGTFTSAGWVGAVTGTINGISATKIGYLTDVTSNIQAQLDAKQSVISLTANRAVISNGSGGLTVSTATNTEIGYLSGVTSAIQTQLNNKQGLDSDLTAIAALSTQAFGRSLLTQADAPTARTTLDASRLTASRSAVTPATDDYIGVTDTSDSSAERKVLISDLVSLTVQMGTLTATTSGTTKDFTGIPANTKKIILSLNGVSLNGTSDLLVQLGDSGGIETSGYVSSAAWLFNASPAAATSNTSGFLVRAAGDASYSVSGHVTLILMDASTNLWAESHTTANIGASAGVGVGGGTKSLSGTLTQIRLTSVSGNTFDAGSINITYE